MPYTSSGLVTSALTFHKDFCKRIVQTYGMSVASSVLLNEGVAYDAVQIIDYLKLPVFVKPNNGGSSVGISKVKSVDQLAPALEKALRRIIRY